MEEHQRKWEACQQVIRQEVGTRVYDTWFAGIVCVSYDEQQHTVLLEVPHRLVYEYIEELHVQMMQRVLSQGFMDRVVLNYRIRHQEPSFADVAAYLQQHSAYDSRRDPYHIAVPNARKRLEDGLRYFVGDAAKWLPAYDRVVEWLTDNKGRGLLCLGTPGMGKTLICQKILPVILGNGGRPIASVMATELHDRLEELKRERIVIIDDLGKESRKHFGNIDNSFFELCNNAERTGQLLVITTNLSTTPYDRTLYPDSILERYGNEVLDRLKVITKVVRIEGESLRT